MVYLAAMSHESREEIARKYQNYSIYALLNTRGALPGFHWGIFIPTASPDGYLWHATNREGGWKLEHKKSSNVPFSLSLLLAHKIGSVSESDLQPCVDVLNGVPGDGRPSPNTDEKFDCRIWVKDAIIALEKNKIITLKEPLSSIETYLVNTARHYKPGVETGLRTAEVENDD